MQFPKDQFNGMLRIVKWALEKETDRTVNHFEYWKKKKIEQKSHFLGGFTHYYQEEEDQYTPP